MRILIVVVLMMLSHISWGQQQWLHCGSWVDVDNGKMKGEAWIKVEAGKIVQITQEKPEQKTIIELAGKTCVPGLIDLHTHMSMQFSPTAYSEPFVMNPSERVLRAAMYAKTTLLAGFTTVRDLGDYDNISISLKHAIAKGWVEGPRIFTAAKALATTGGHADPSNGRRWDMMGHPGADEGVVDSVESARRAVRKRYKDGADLIKITATGGVLSVAASGDNPQFTQQELNAIVEIAHDYGFHVAAHAHGKEGMKRAVIAGVTTIEHGTYMDDEVMKLMKQHGTWYVPTIIAGNWVAEKAAIDGYFPEIVRPKAAKIGPQIKSTFAKAYKAGVKIAFGTDAGVYEHGRNAEEFKLMVEQGMPAMEAIQSATTSAAEVLSKSSELGSISVGKSADIIAVSGNPVEDITLLQQVDFVMKKGKVYKNK